MTELQAAELLQRMTWVNEKLAFVVGAQFIMMGVIIGIAIVAILGVYMRDI